jgi:heptose I phosphotransferase
MQMPPHMARAFAAANAEADAFEQVMALSGVVFRDAPARRTLRFELLGKSYFAKLHSGVGWGEIFKNLLTLRRPIASAMTEVYAIRKLNELGIPTTPLVAYGCRGSSPASLRSFVITEDLGDIISLETLCADWKKNPPDARFKWRLIVAVAKIARTLHGNGLNHRDFYICHFCLDKQRLISDEIYLYLIDLHRVGVHEKIRPDARMKDMAALYFSAMDAGLSKRDYFRFLRAYRQRPLHEVLSSESNFWEKVEKRAIQLYLKYHGNIPVINRV